MFFNPKSRVRHIRYLHMEVISLFSLSYSVVKTLVSSHKDICYIISFSKNNIIYEVLHLF
jgi:hypothetical protein